MRHNQPNQGNVVTTAEAALISRADAIGDLTEIPAGLSAQRRRTLRRQLMIELRRHPITTLPLHPLAPADASNKDRYPRGFTCGTCAHRVLLSYHTRDYPKCDELTPSEMAKHTARTDTYRWLPACVAYRPA